MAAMQRTPRSQGKPSSHHSALRGLDLNAIIPSTQPSRNKTRSIDETDDDDDDFAFPGIQRTTRASRNGRAQVNYSTKYHPMDEFTRQVNTAKRDKKSELSRSDLRNEDEVEFDDDSSPARTIRAARNGRAKVRYSMEYHPLDEVTRPVNATKQRKQKNSRGKNGKMVYLQESDGSNDSIRFDESDDGVKATVEVIEVSSAERVKEDPPGVKLLSWHKHALRLDARGFPRPRKTASLERIVAAADDCDGESLDETPIPVKRSRKRSRSMGQNDRPVKSAKIGKSTRKIDKAGPQSTELETMPYDNEDGDDFQEGSNKQTKKQDLVVIRPYHRPSLATKFGLRILKPYVKAVSIASTNKNDLDEVLNSIFDNSQTTNPIAFRPSIPHPNSTTISQPLQDDIEPFSSESQSIVQSPSLSLSSKRDILFGREVSMEPPSDFKEQYAATETQFSAVSETQYLVDSEITEEFGTWWFPTR